LRELKERFKGYGYPNVEISKFLTTKSIDQITYQRRKLKLAGEGTSSQEADQETEGGCDLVDPGNAYWIEPVISEDNESTTAWKLSLKDAILTPTDVPPVLRKLYDRLEEIFNLNQGIVEALGNEIDKFIDKHLYGVIKRINNIADEKDNKIQNKSQNTWRRNNRNSRKRFSYARCQDVFKECPKRLADVVINDDRAYLEPARQPPAAVDIKRHYEDLWGHVGPSSVRIINNRAAFKRLFLADNCWGCGGENQKDKKEGCDRARWLIERTPYNAWPARNSSQIIQYVLLHFRNILPDNK
jgi:hypothetical protein